MTKIITAAIIFITFLPLLTSGLDLEEYEDIETYEGLEELQATDRKFISININKTSLVNQVVDAFNFTNKFDNLFNVSKLNIFSSGKDKSNALLKKIALGFIGLPVIAFIGYFFLILAFPDPASDSKFERDVTKVVQHMGHMATTVEDSFFDLLEDLTDPHQQSPPEGYTYTTDNYMMMANPDSNQNHGSSHITNNQHHSSYSSIGPVQSSHQQSSSYQSLANNFHRRPPIQNPNMFNPQYQFGQSSDSIPSFQSHHGPVLQQSQQGIRKQLLQNPHQQQKQLQHQLLQQQLHQQNLQQQLYQQRLRKQLQQQYLQKQLREQQQKLLHSQHSSYQQQQQQQLILHQLQNQIKQINANQKQILVTEQRPNSGFKAGGENPHIIPYNSKVNIYQFSHNKEAIPSQQPGINLIRSRSKVKKEGQRFSKGSRGTISDDNLTLPRQKFTIEDAVTKRTNLKRKLDTQSKINESEQSLHDISKNVSLSHVKESQFKPSPKDVRKLA